MKGALTISGVARHKPRLRRPSRTADAGNSFVLYNIPWSTYCTISDALVDRFVRMAYDRGTLEFMTVSRRHEGYKSLLGQLVEVLTEEFDLPMQGVGSMTCRREDLERGIEPDDCWYIASLAKLTTKGELDLTRDPPPDLALEIDVSRSSLNRVSIYEALRVPEVWRFDGETLEIKVLAADGRYRVEENSPTFFGIPIAEIVSFLKQGVTGDHNAVKKAFRRWIRQHRRKRKK